MLLEGTNSRVAADLLVPLERDSGVALHSQIETWIRDAIRAGRLPRGISLPPTRGLARDLGVSRGVVVEAYQQLVAEGYLTSRRGGYTRVAAGPETVAMPAAPALADAPRIDFCPCRADGSQFPRAAWLRSMRRVLTQASAEDFGYVRGRGAPALQHALAAYLNRVRGTSARPRSDRHLQRLRPGHRPDHPDAAQAPGATRLAVEDPCADDDAVPAARAAGLEVIGVPVGEHGISVDALERIDADALVLTPSHQWPTGAVLAAEARPAVLRWAQRRGALVVEDDYDAEYRYDRAPVGAMQGLAPEQVIYAGYREQDPGARACGSAGWSRRPAWSTTSPRPRRSPTAARRCWTSSPSRTCSSAASSTATSAVCGRSTAAAATRWYAPSGNDSPSSNRRGSPPACTWSPICPAISTRRRSWTPPPARGVALYGLAPYRVSHEGRPGLIFGYATLDERTIGEGVDVLADVVAEARA